jgi:hypothetical protein
MHRAARWGLAAALAALVFAPAARAANPTAGMKTGTPDLKSAGPLAFAEDGILLVGDTKGAALFAIDTGDRTKVADKAPVRVADLAGKVAARLGTDPKKVMINDVAVNPASGKVYLSVSRGKGPDAAPVILRVGADGSLDELALDNVRFARAEIPNPPDPTAQARGQSLRAESITDLAYVDGRVFVAGLSNEEFSSRLMAVPFPFTEQADGAAIEIYHGAHGRFETRSPVRTFVAYTINDKPYLLAAYTCTPLVKVPVADLKPGAHVKGTTIAELGNRNRPLDMVVYQKGGKDYLLLANSSRGVMKIPTEGADSAERITAPVPDGKTQGLGYEKVTALKGVVQLDKLDAGHALVAQFRLRLLPALRHRRHVLAALIGRNDAGRRGQGAFDWSRHQSALGGTVAGRGDHEPERGEQEGEAEDGAGKGMIPAQAPEMHKTGLQCLSPGVSRSFGAPTAAGVSSGVRTMSWSCDCTKGAS